VPLLAWERYVKERFACSNIPDSSNAETGASGTGGSTTRHRQRITKSTRCTDLRAAEKVLRRWERKAADPDHDAANEATIGDALRLVGERIGAQVETGRRSPDTARFYTVKVGHLARILDAESPLARLDSGAVDRYELERQREGAADVTIAKELGVLRRALQPRPASEALEAAIRAKSSRIRSARHRTAARAGSRPKSSDASLAELVPDRAARVAFIVASSARIGESDRARREDVEGSLVRVRGTKTKRSASARTPVVLDAQEALLAYALEYAEGTDGLLFAPWGNVRRDHRRRVRARDESRRAPRTTFSRTFAQWLKQAGAGDELIGTGDGSRARLEGHGEHLHASRPRAARRRAPPSDCSTCAAIDRGTAGKIGTVGSEKRCVHRSIRAQGRNRTADTRIFNPRGAVANPAKRR
jgi:hypothetical protein